MIMWRNPGNKGASCRFQLLNQRAGVQFLFFRNITQVGNFSQLELVGNSSVVAVENANEPVQGHLALTAKGPRYTNPILFFSLFENLCCIQFQPHVETAVHPSRIEVLGFRV